MLSNHQNQVGRLLGPCLKVARQSGLGRARTGTLNHMDSQDFSEELANCSGTGFKGKFGQVSRRLGLRAGLNRSELSCLYDAAFLAALCNIAFNGLGGCGGEIRPEKEPVRRRLEQGFMNARTNFYACPGWKRLPEARKKSINRVLLAVGVADENLAQ